jgi:hypothetical protein
MIMSTENHHELEELTLDNVCTILEHLTLPLYKGFADDKPSFRKALTKEETRNLLEGIHHIIIAIKLQQIEEGS